MIDAAPVGPGLHHAGGKQRLDLGGEEQPIALAGPEQWADADAIAGQDERQQTLILARDRIGICPLFWTRQGDWLLFASEVKALLASGMVEARPDRRGINHLFTFFALPG